MNRTTADQEMMQQWQQIWSATAVDLGTLREGKSGEIKGERKRDNIVGWDEEERMIMSLCEFVF